MIKTFSSTFLFLFLSTCCICQDSVSNIAVNFLNQGVEYFKSKNFEEAIKSYTNAIDESPLYLKAYYNRGNAFLNLKNYENAIKDYTRCIKIDRKFTKALLYRAYSYSYNKQNDLALRDYDDLITQEPDNVQALSNRGTLYIEKGQHEKALEDFSKTVELADNKEVRYYTNLATAQYNLSRYEESINSLIKAEKISTSYKINELRTKNLIKLERYDEAIVELNYCIKLDNSKIENYYLRGFCKQRVENHQAAINDFNIYLESNEDNIKGLEYRAISLIELKKYEEAISDITKVFTVQKNKNLLFQRASCYLALANYENAKVDLKEAISLDNKFTEAYFNLSTVNSKLGETDEMCKNLKKSLELGYVKAQEYVLTYCK
jgi:tetratricopeptide (TPR) repeat protein